MFDNKQNRIFLLVFISLLLYAGFSSRETVANQASQNEGIIRFHVIANSNSDEDQRLKLKVRDAVLESINEELVKETMSLNIDAEKKAFLDINESRKYIEDSLSKIEIISEKVIKENGYKYQANAKLSTCWIPEKKYGEIVFPAGNYEALNITIGEGEGDNWWCVLFPPLCIVDPQPGDIEKKLAQDDFLGNTTGSSIKLKFKTVEAYEALKVKNKNAKAQAPKDVKNVKNTKNTKTIK